MIKAREKPFFFGRTQMDTVAHNLAASHPRFSEACWEEECKKIEDNLMANLGKLSIDFDEERDKDSIFLLARTKQEKIHPRLGKSVIIGFPGLDKLAASIAEKLPELHRQALIFSMGPPDTEKMLKTKVFHIRLHIIFFCLASSAATFVPIPGANAAGDIGLIEMFRKFAENQLGIDSVNLEAAAIKINMTKDAYVARVLEKFSGFELKLYEALCGTATTMNLLKMFASFGVAFAASEVLEEGLKWGGLYTAGITAAIAATISGGMMAAVLETMLRYFKKFALECIAVSNARIQELQEDDD